MKHILFPLIPAAMLLASCASASTPASSSTDASTGASSQESSLPASVEAKSTDLKIAAPFGAPSVALFPYLKNSSGNIEGTSGANIGTFFAQGSGKDIVIAPTNAGISAIKAKSAPYKLAATVTFGNFFLAATGNDENKTLDPDDYVVAFQQGQVPDKVFRYVYDNLTNVHYIAGQTQTPASTLITGKDQERDDAKVDYVLIPEPALTTALSKQPKASIYANVQEDYAKKTGGKSIMQASIFVHNDAEKGKVSSFLAGVKEGVEAFLASPNVIDCHVEGMSEADQKAAYTATIADIKTMTAAGNRMGLGYKDAYENRDSVSSFLSLWNMGELDEKVYYR